MLKTSTLLNGIRVRRGADGVAAMPCRIAPVRW